MNVWIVGVSDCESNEIKCVCLTKEIAERELFKVRDALIVEWKKADVDIQVSIRELCEKEQCLIWEERMYKKMITALLGNDYERWENFPHDRPYLYKVNVMEV
jgi:hypothetical protein